MSQIGPIFQKDEIVLRQKAAEVPLASIRSRKILSIIKRMKSALAAEIDGVAIAAPQIGESLRIFVVSGEWLAKSRDPENNKKSDDLVFINPKIIKLSKEHRLMEEGCLSVRYLYGKVKRARQATIEYYDENGKKNTRGASGIMAQIFQHETDHLEGILFIDKTTNLEEIPPQSLNNRH